MDNFFTAVRGIGMVLVIGSAWVLLLYFMYYRKDEE